MSNNPLITVFCITYNHVKYIRVCLDGFVMQKTNFRFVAIIHDDASTDGTASIIREYAEKYPDIIQPIYETENQYSKQDGSIKRIMQEAINATGCKYVAICEGDDYWTDPYKLQKQVDFLEGHPNVGLCYTDYNIYNEEKKKLYPAVFTNGAHRSRDFNDHLLTRGYIAPMTWVYRIELQDLFRSMGTHPDGTFAMSLETYHHSSVAYLDEVTATYRVHANSASRPATMERQWLYVYGVMQTQLTYAQKYGDQSLVEKVYLNSYLIDVLPLAIQMHKTDFINEAKTFLTEKGINVDEQIDIIENYQESERQYNKIRHSRAYKLGVALLTPFQKLKSILRKIKKKK